MNLGGSVKINKCGMLILTLVLLLCFYYLAFARKTQTNYGLKNANDINLRKLLIGSIQAATKGGIEVLAVSQAVEINARKKGKTKEGAEELITDADRKSHCAMQQGLRRIFPKLKIISEEDSSDVPCPELNLFDLDPTVLHDSVMIQDEFAHIDEVTVWIDPLDATQEFSEKLFEYVTTMVCVAIKGQPIIGVIHNPFTQKTTWAWVDRAFTEDLSRLRRDEGPVKNPILILSRSHTGDGKQMMRDIFGENSNIIMAGGAGYKVLQVAYSNASAYVHRTDIKKWDICAGNAILNAIGGKMTTLHNEQIDYSDENDFVNKEGLLATLVNHNYYIEKFIANNKETSR